MNILNKVTRKSLEKNRVRTLVTVIGIVLSIAMFTAVTTSVSSVQNFMVQVIKNTEGSWYGKVSDLTYDQAQEIGNQEQVTLQTVTENVGYATIESSNEYKPYLYIMGVDENTQDLLPINLTSGRMPETTDEILLPEHLSTNGGVKYDLHDTITLEVGERSFQQTTLWQEEGLMVAEDGTLQEELIRTQSKTYTVVGFYERPGFESTSSAGYTAITLADAGGTSYNLYLQNQSMRSIKTFLNDYSKQYAVSYHDDLIRYSGNSTENDLNRVLYPLAVILMGLIMFGSVSLIYNAFSISVSERTKQFGILKSVGATKKQMRGSVLYEAFVLALIGIPVGILAGIGGMAVTFRITEGLFQSFMSGTNTAIALHVSWLAILMAIFIGFLTVLISAYIPAMRAARKPAIDAIRQTGDIQFHAKKVRTSKLTYWIAGFEGMLASKNFKRNRKRYRATVISLFLSVVLFISATSFCSYLTDSVNAIVQTIHYELAYSHEASEDKISDENLKSFFASQDGVEQVAYAARQNQDTTLNISSITKEAFDLMKKYNMIDDTDTEFSANLNLYFVEDEFYQEYLSQQKLDVDQYMNTENPRALVYDNLLVMEEGKYRRVELITDELSSMTVNDYESNTTYEIALGEKVSEAPYFINANSGGTVILMYPYSAMEQVLHTTEKLTTMFYMKSDSAKATFTNLYTKLQDKGFAAENLQNAVESIEANKALLIVLKIFAYGFITLISLISTANVFNTISTNIALRRREFAMLRSVGMTQKSFVKMMNYECLLYGLKGLIYGIPVALFLTYLIYRSIRNGLEMSFYIPWSNVWIAIGSVFLVVFSTMLYSMNRIKKDNTIETLKNENM